MPGGGRACGTRGYPSEVRAGDRRRSRRVVPGRTPSFEAERKQPSAEPRSRVGGGEPEWATRT
jgi:hypothetical protein